MHIAILLAALATSFVVIFRQRYFLRRYEQLTETLLVRNSHLTKQIVRTQEAQK
jgi:hypothetical protein